MNKKEFFRLLDRIDEFAFEARREAHKRKPNLDHIFTYLDDIQIDAKRAIETLSAQEAK